MLAGCALLSKEDIPALKRAGFDYGEFMGKYIASLAEEEFQTLRALMDEEETSCLGLNAYCARGLTIAGPGFDPKEIREYARLCAQRGSLLGVRFVGIGSPASRHLPGGYPLQTAAEQLEEFLKITAEEFGRYDITVCLEALADCYCNFINTVPEALDIVSRIGWENIRLVLDLYNMEHMGETGLEYASFRDYIAHVHTSDDDGSPYRRFYLKNEKKQQHEQRLTELIHTGYKGGVTLEIDVPLDPEKGLQSCSLIKKI